jgi:hypothetical protein
VGHPSRWTEGALEGGELTDGQCAALELRLQEHPADLEARIKLLGNYGSRRFDLPEISSKRVLHILWFVENHPEHPIAGSPFADCLLDIDGATAYKELKMCWLRHLRLGNAPTTVLSNAAQFFLQYDKELSEKCLLQAKALHPDDCDISTELALLYHLWKRPEKQRALHAGHLFKQAQESGFALVPSAISEEHLDQLLLTLEQESDSSASIARKSGTYAIRHLLRVAAVQEFAKSAEVRWLAQAVIGDQAFPVRAMLLDKIEGANWYVAWHQDLTIAVKSRIDTEGYGPWSVKAGVQHVQPPASILEQMIALRIHFDDCLEDNGALKFVPGSHRRGVLDQSEIDRLKQTETITCSANRGSVLIMHPMILHSSSRSKSPLHRRVLHIEYAATNLDNGLEWAIA